MPTWCDWFMEDARYDSMVSEGGCLINDPRWWFLVEAAASYHYAVMVDQTSSTLGNVVVDFVATSSDDPRFCVMSEVCKRSPEYHRLRDGCVVLFAARVRHWCRVM
jgi:hypothetical protein